MIFKEPRGPDIWLMDKECKNYFYVSGTSMKKLGYKYDWKEYTKAGRLFVLGGTCLGFWEDS
jgi:hypothetical protein